MWPTISHASIKVGKFLDSKNDFLPWSRLNGLLFPWYNLYPMWISEKFPDILTEVSIGLPHPLQANARTVYWNRQWPPTSKSFSTHNPQSSFSLIKRYICSAVEIALLITTNLIIYMYLFHSFTMLYQILRILNIKRDTRIFTNDESGGVQKEVKVI
jgi:hypothetical protein